MVGRYLVPTIFSRGLTLMPPDVLKRLYNSPCAAVDFYTPLDWDSGNSAFTMYDLH